MADLITKSKIYLDRVYQEVRDWQKWESRQLAWLGRKYFPTTYYIARCPVSGIVVVAQTKVTESTLTLRNRPLKLIT